VCVCVICKIRCDYWSLNCELFFFITIVWKRSRFCTNDMRYRYQFVSKVLLFIFALHFISNTNEITITSNESVQSVKPLAEYDSSDCLDLILISFFSLLSPSTKLPHYSRFWMQSCDRLSNAGLKCMLNVVLWSSNDSRTTVNEIMTCSEFENATETRNSVIIKIWTKSEFYASLKSIGVDIPKDKQHKTHRKLSDLKPLYGALSEPFIGIHHFPATSNLSEQFIQNTSSSPFQSPHCYKRWGWVDVDGAIGLRLMKKVVKQNCDHSAESLSNAPTPVFTYHGKGMWRPPSWSGQIATFCNTPKGRQVNQFPLATTHFDALCWLDTFGSSVPIICNLLWKMKWTFLMSWNWRSVCLRKGWSQVE